MTFSEEIKNSIKDENYENFREQFIKEIEMNMEDFSKLIFMQLILHGCGNSSELNLTEKTIHSTDNAPLAYIPRSYEDSELSLVGDIVAVTSEVLPHNNWGYS